jgi:diadenosine tetraphosphate (Ap4A) HIT family hydrolase
MGEFHLHERLEQDTYWVGDMELCRVLLMNNQHFPWVILVPRVPDIREIHDLSDEQQVRLIRESSRVGRVLMAQFDAQKLNVAALGNMVPQLHVHHVVRFATDPCWPAPVWGSPHSQCYEPSVAQAIVAQLKAGLAL